jgi:hypothetical protein
VGQLWDGIWLTVAFVTELAAVAALGYWGFALDGTQALRWAAGIGLPLVAAVLWGVFAAPRAPVQVLAITLLVKAVVFGGAVLALFRTGHPRLALALGVLAVLGSVLSPSPAAVALGGGPAQPVPPG